MHPEAPAVTNCGSCGRPLCAACRGFRVDGEPWCAQCVPRLEEPVSPFYPVALVGLSSAGLALVVRALSRVFDTVPFWALATAWLTLCVGLAMGVHKLFRRAKAARASVVVEEVEEDAPSVAGPGGSPYRTGLRRVTRRLSPPVPGWAAALSVCSVLAFTAAAVPTALALPRWVEVEIVLTLWWLVWAGALTTLLYRGSRLTRDAHLTAAMRRGPDEKPSTKSGYGVTEGFGDGLSGLGGADADGCLFSIVVLVVLAVAFGAAWVFVELVVPLVVVGALGTVLAGLRRVAHSQHECQGNLGRALGFGVVWATLYTAPFACLVGAVHLVLLAG